MMWCGGRGNWLICRMIRQRILCRMNWPHWILMRGGNFDIGVIRIPSAIRQSAGEPPRHGSHDHAPGAVDGWLDLPGGVRIGIERAHMEEDAGKSTHVGSTGRVHGATASLIDLNRAGVPLVEALDSVGGASGNYIYLTATQAIKAARNGRTIPDSSPAGLSGDGFPRNRVPRQDIAPGPPRRRAVAREPGQRLPHARREAQPRHRDAREDPRDARPAGQARRSSGNSAGEMNSIPALLWVAVGGAVGSVARAMVGVLVLLTTNC